MKVSAPVVPIPDAPPTPPADFGSTEALLPPPDEAVPPSVALATWPEWFKPVDIALGILAVVLAFLLASFTARNSDIWRHLGTGRLLVQGKYPIGGDPLSFTGAGRAWVNSNWMFDVAMYASYTADDSGTVAVVLKALAFAAAFGILFLLRKPNEALWPWAVMATLGIIATGTQASLRPYAFGMLLEAVVLVLIYRGDWAGPKWRMPAIFGGVCWVWACTDSLYFFGPLTLLLVLAGEFLHRKLSAGEPVSAGEDPFWSPPPREALFRGLLAGVIGVLLNPMFLGALARSPLDALEQLVPFELTFGWGDLFAGDDALTSITLSPMSNGYADKTERGDNVTGYCAVALLVIGGLLLGFGYARLRATQILLWFSFVALALVHYRFISMAGLVAVPLAAAHWNGLSRFRLQGTFDPRTKMILNLSGIGRIVSVAGLVVLLGFSIPGRLHAPVSLSMPAYNRRVSWGIEEEIGMSRNARMIERWRTEGSIPPEARGLLSYHDFGDYCAWFAPDEKVFINSRYRFHSRELADLAAIRKELRPKSSDATTADTPGILKTLADKYGADFFVLGQWNQRVRYYEIFQVAGDFEKAKVKTGIAQLHLDGRISIVCRTDTPTGLSAARKLNYSPEREAFGPDATAVPCGEPSAPRLAVEGWLSELLWVPEPGSVSTDDAILFTELARYTGDQGQQIWNFLRRRSTIGGWIGSAALQAALDPGPRFPDGQELAYPILSCRAARRAIAETKDDPEAYRALGESYSLDYLGILNRSESELQRMTAIRRFLDRLSVSPYRNEPLIQRSLADEYALFFLHLEAGQLDLALDLLTKASGRVKNASLAEIPNPELMKNWSDRYRRITLEQQFNLPTGSLVAVTGAPDTVLAEAIASVILRRFQSEGQRPTNEEALKFYQKVLGDVTSTSLDAAEKKDKPVPRDAAWVQARAKLLEDRFKREVGRLTEASQQGPKSAGLAVKFLTAIRFRLFGRAIEMISTQKDWEKLTDTELTVPLTDRASLEILGQWPILQTTAKRQFDPNTKQLNAIVLTDIGLNLQMIQFQFLSGKLDIATLDLDTIATRLQEVEKDSPNNPVLAASNTAIKQLRSLQWRLEGNTVKTAEEVGQQLRQIPKFTEAQLAGMRVPPDQWSTPLGALAGPLPTISDPFGGIRAGLVQEANLHYELGMTALFAGNNAEARLQFGMALRPQGVPVASLNIAAENPLVSYASRYLRLLDQFAEPPKR